MSEPTTATDDAPDDGQTAHDARSDEPAPDIEPAPADRRDPTRWERLADAEAIELRDPLAELLGMVPEGEPLSFTFAEVAKAAGHACPAVAGAYRATQLALAELYPDAHPVRSEIRVTFGGDPDDPGLGPMAAAVEHLTGAADETGFAGFGGHGGRQNLLSFGEVAAPGPGRAFAFTRSDTGETVRVAFDPRAAGTAPPDAGDAGGDGESGGHGPGDLLPKLIAGEASAAERERFREAWHRRVRRVLAATPGADGPFALDRSASPDGA